MMQVPAAGTGFDPTFNYYMDYTAPGPASGNTISLVAGSVLGGLRPDRGNSGNPADTICQKLNLPLTGRYVVLGVGPRCSMVGKTMALVARSLRGHPGPEPGVWLRAYLRRLRDFGLRTTRISRPPSWSAWARSTTTGSAPPMTNCRTGISSSKTGPEITRRVGRAERAPPHGLSRKLVGLAPLDPPYFATSSYVRTKKEHDHETRITNHHQGRLLRRADLATGQPRRVLHATGRRWQ